MCYHENKEVCEANPHPSSRVPEEGVAETSALLVAKRFDRLLNTWTVMHECQEPIKPDVNRKND